MAPVMCFTGYRPWCTDIQHPEIQAAVELNGRNDTVKSMNNITEALGFFSDIMQG